MFAIFSTLRAGAESGLHMTDNRTRTSEELQAEWLEVQAAQEDPAAFRPLYQRYFEPIFRYIFKRTADESLTADIASQVFLKAMQKIHSYTFTGVPFGAWLYRIASNEVHQHYRNASKKRVVSVDERSLAGVLDLVEEEAEAKEALELNESALKKALQQLKPSDLQFVEMRFFERRPFKEMAEILEITESNAKVKTYRIIAKLRKFMTK